MSVSERQLVALLRLLEDESAEVQRALSAQLRQLDPEMRERLRQMASGMPALVRARLRGQLAAIEGGDLERRFSKLAAASDQELDLEEGAFLIAAFGYPEEELSFYRGMLDRMANELALHLRPRPGPAETAQLLSDYLFQHEGFQGNVERYYDPDNSYMNRVLERKRGIPISLSAVYLFLGRRLGIPLRGVGMPGHFIVKLEEEEGFLLLDPFHEGRPLTRAECAALVGRFGFRFEDRLLATTPDRAILERMLSNLIHAYRRSDHPAELEKARQLTRFLKIVHFRL